MVANEPKILMEVTTTNGMVMQIVSEYYHYIMYIDGKPGFHSTDYERVEAYVDNILSAFKK